MLPILPSNTSASRWVMFACTIGVNRSWCSAGWPNRFSSLLFRLSERFEWTAACRSSSSVGM